MSLNSRQDEQSLPALRSPLPRTYAAIERGGVAATFVEALPSDDSLKFDDIGCFIKHSAEAYWLVSGGFWNNVLDRPGHNDYELLRIWVRRFSSRT